MYHVKNNQETKEEKRGCSVRGRGPGKVTAFVVAIKAKRVWSEWDGKLLPAAGASLPVEKKGLWEMKQGQAGRELVVGPAFLSLPHD